MTVKELYERCKKEIENGKGDNDIILCVNQDEFYSLESGFSSPVYNDSGIYDFIEDTMYDDDVIVLN